MKKKKILQIICITAIVSNIVNTTTLAAPNMTSTKEYVSLAKIDSNKNIKVINSNGVNQKNLETQKLEDAIPTESAFISEPQKLFNTGDLNSKNFRIPSLLTTKSGTTIAATDIRNNHAGDSPANIDAGIRISKDGGKTWGQAKRVIDYPGNASVIDSSMLEDEETGKVFLFITAFPENYGFPQCDKTATGFEIFENEQCMILYDGASTAGQKGQGNKYYVKPDGFVYNSNGEKTSYTVDINNNLYENGIKISNTFLAESPLKALGTAYLTIIESSDEGETWSDPKIISGMVKKDWMRFIGAAPGVGIQIKNGEKAGRLIYPLYYTNSKGFQSSAVMYSDDHGETWKLGESPNDSRDGHNENSDTIGRGNQLTEAQVVQMPDGQLKMFMRNTGSYVRIATSFDGGETWDSDVYEDKHLREPYCQLSVINYDGLIDEKKAIIFSNPNATSSRTNGTVRIGLLNENGTHSNGRTKYEIDWKYNKTIVPGNFAYSSISQLSNETIGLFYEGATNLSVDFLQMNIEYLKTKS